MNFARLPVGEMIIGFLVAVIVVTFIFAFNATGGGGGGSSTSSSSPSASATSASATLGGGGGGGGLAITATDNAFDPTSLTVKAGAAVTITLTNKGVGTHNLHIAGADGSFTNGVDVSDPQAVSGGQTGTVSWQAPAQAGTFSYHCDFHPDQMKGTITVQ